MVLTARVRIRGGELGVTESAYEGKNSAGNPHGDESLNAAGVLCHQLRCAEDSNTDHQADNQSHGIEGREIGPRGHAVRLLRLDTARRGRWTLAEDSRKRAVSRCLGSHRMTEIS
jgi:hypothetical protein